VTANAGWPLRLAASRRRAAVRATFALACLCVPVLSAGAGNFEAAGEDIRGLWVDHEDVERRKVAVLIDDCDGRLCGHIAWLKKPTTAKGEPKRDRRNPDAALRDRPLCGLRILSSFRRVERNAWGEGAIYNPSDGQTYSSTMTLESDGTLTIRGYVGFTWLGKSVAWVRDPDQEPDCLRGARQM
jgi:uncharacterized protein (DUF2147 family)